MTEEQFWKCTLRKLMLLWHDYRVFNGLEKEEEKEVYINEIF
jgi:hypothetical protein